MPTGVKSWSCEFACGQRIFLGRADFLGLSEARASARATLADVYLGIDPIDARKPQVPVPNLAAILEGDYATWAKANQRAHAKTINRLQSAFRKLLDKPFAQVSGLQTGRSVGDHPLQPACQGQEVARR
jgi:hypothetical protein